MARDRVSEEEAKKLDEVRARLDHQLGLVASVDTKPLPLATQSGSDDEAAWKTWQGWRPMSHHLNKRQLWDAIYEEAMRDAASEPTLASYLYSTILSHKSFETALAFTLANKLANNTLLGTQLMVMIEGAYRDEPELVESCMADLQAVFDRDPACERYSQALLCFKGFQAVQAQRLANWLWRINRKPLALAIQSRMSEVFHVDIHPAATLGRGLMIDHATGVVIGETAVVGDNVSLLHHVTLGGSGTGRGVRHPQIGHGVLLGAGATVLGPVVLGAGCKVGAGSVVVTDLPDHVVAVGVPARVVKRDIHLLEESLRSMDSGLHYVLDYII
ncbi:hypothetical protein HYH03_009212 [Edaphochlamys debaryana]|uniref:serine O-acetyltransferase n=1 Tax=Edaphochlamys debaryana TaxID=47281 RepID=A0A835Y0T5_9CHLO|nr:hypothetical protein HYH03_009212 [Edaphochlamys debaryana]|eukprot:KAG2492548.1 hypothetical protein HYH03_009212 [Edaphochlamys debaryana]